jgi:methionyl-tRNA formyltransferase
MTRDNESAPRIVLAGSVQSSLATGECLIEHGLNTVGVLALSPSHSARVSGYHDLGELAARHGIPFVHFDRINEAPIIEVLRKWKPDVLFVVGLSQLVAKEILDLPTLGCVGFHPTALPEGRGRAPLAWLVLNKSAGAATFFQMDEGADSGSIFVQEPFAVGEDDDAEAIENRIIEAIRAALQRWLPGLKAGQWDPEPQDESRASWSGRRAPEDGLIDWRDPALAVRRLIQAAGRPHPGAYTHYGAYRIAIWSADIADEPWQGVPGRILRIDEDKGYLVQTGTQPLWLRELSVLEGPETGMKPEALLKVGQRLGYGLEDEIFALREKLSGLEVELQELRKLIR